MSTAFEREEESGKEVRLFPKQDRTLTHRQKEMIRRRDGGKCQFPEPHICNGHCQTLHVHHITPFSVVTRLMGMSADAADGPTNLISVCEEIHIGGRRNPSSKVLHPDTVKARRSYHENKKSYEEMFAERERRLRSGRLYHRSDLDAQMKAQAFIATNEGERSGTFSRAEFRAASKRRTRRTGPEAPGK